MGINEISQFFRQFSGKLGANIYAGFNGPTSPQQLAFLRALQKEVRQNSSLDTPLNKLKAVVFDLETTGFHPEKGDQVISIGAIKMLGYRIDEEETFYSLLKSDCLLPIEISSLTNIRNEDLQRAPNALNVLLQFFKYIKSDLLVAHHSKHEQAFMQKLTRDLLRTKFEHRIVDTSFLIRIADPSIKSWTLEEVCEKNGIEIKNRHHALGDAIMTAHVWSCYLQKAEAKGFKNLREVYEYLARNE